MKTRITNDDFRRVSRPIDLVCHDFTKSEITSGLNQILSGFDTREAALQKPSTMLSEMSTSIDRGWGMSVHNIVVVRDIATKIITLVNRSIGPVIIHEIECHEEYVVVHYTADVGEAALDYRRVS